MQIFVDKDGIEYHSIEQFRQLHKNYVFGEDVDIETLPKLGLKAKQANVSELDFAKSVKLRELNEQFEKKWNDKAIIDSEYQFKINADQRALSNVNALLEIVLDGDNIDFIDGENNVVEITHEQLVNIKKTIVKYRVDLYNKKWKIRERILKAENQQQLDDIEIVI